MARVIIQQSGPTLVDDVVITVAREKQTSLILPNPGSTISYPPRLFTPPQLLIRLHQVSQSDRTYSSLPICITLDSLAPVAQCGARSADRRLTVRPSPNSLPDRDGCIRRCPRERLRHAFTSHLPSHRWGVRVLLTGFECTSAQRQY